MPASPTQPSPRSPRIESTNDHPLAVVADTPEHPQPGTIPIPPILGLQERSATLESLLEALNRATMPENPTLNTTPSSHPRAAMNRPQEPPSHRHVRPVIPDPVIAGPNAPMAVLPPSTPGNQRQQRLSIAGRILMFFGYGRNNRARKELVSAIWALAVDFSQIIAIITLLTISTHSESPTIRNLNEWDACGKPLGIWNALWVVRLSLDVWLSIWRWSRERTKRLLDESAGHVVNDVEAQTRTYPNAAPPGGRRHGPAVQRSANNPSESPSSQATPTPYPRVYARLSLLGSTFTLVWFVLAQIFVYSSTNSCRKSSPHLWWLTFGVLSVMYLMILEVVLVAILVFVVGPILFLFWSILLLCLGRHPSQNPHHFTPDIGQVPRSVVDKLPLVLYIPPPPDQPSKPVTIPSDLHTYPPKSPDPPRRFNFFRRRGTSTGGTRKTGAGAAKGGPKRPLTWEDNWERGEYPFVQLDVHRASCAICLLDFQEPKRVSVGDLKTVEVKTDSEAQAQAQGGNEAIGGREGEVEEEVGDVTERTTSPASLNGDHLRLQDAGEGAQPLRLLKCGHVFHKICVDPWLLDVSGRCPVCQRPVRGSEPEEMTVGPDQDARPSRRRWFRRSRRRGPA